MDKGTGGFLQPEKILDQLDIRDNMQIADFGCGHGYFSLPLAKKVSQGKVYALDVLEEALQSIKSRAKIEKVSNIETIRVNLEIAGGSKLTDQSIDLVVLANILFQSQKKDEILKEAQRVLKENGYLVVIDWLAGSLLAPKEGWFISKDEADQLTKKQGLNLVKELIMDDQHYGFVFQK
jgi:ubiquinone/menaquinone biosynthesis C-methylase UbiE